MRFACPVCKTILEPLSLGRLACPQDGRIFERSGGIWRFLPAERLEFFKPFIQDYETIRQAEGRGSLDPAYYRALPFRDLSGRYIADWPIRAASFRTLVRRVITPIGSPKLNILDLGAGNCWLSYRLAQYGHRLFAVDLRTNETDGLGAYRHYGVDFTPVQAEFDCLPLPDGQVNLVIYNASFHYTVDALATLREALRVLAPGGRIALLDTPIYSNPTSGDKMVTERRTGFLDRFGIPSDRLPSENYLTPGRLQELSRALGLAWQTITPFYGLGWLLRPWKARLLGRREPAKFAILIAQA
jgi:SAM-dependent methyltransferase